MQPAHVRRVAVDFGSGLNVEGVEIMSICPTDEELAGYAGGAIDGELRVRIASHLMACRRCAAWVTEAYADDGMLAEFRNTLKSKPVFQREGLAVDVAKGRTSKPFDEENGSRGSAPEELRTAPKIEGYQILGVVGQGGMGIVYRAVQLKLRRTVALKVLPAIFGAVSQVIVDRFRREATAAARLHHTNIVPIYDFGESRDAYYYAMELIEGQPLNLLIRDLLQSGAPAASPAQLATILTHATAHGAPLPRPEVGANDSCIDTNSGSSHGTSAAGRGRAYFRQVARWVADAADALHYAHEQGIIHRDVKPSNLILSRDGRIMVTDFGLAKSEEDASVTLTGSLVGTMRYLSPEQALAKRIPVDHRTDVYSLGATLYELLCLRPAFPGTDDKQILASIITQDPIRPRKILPAVPPELQTICLKTLEKAPDNRYATARAFAEDLRRYLGDLPIVAKNPGALRRTVKLIKRRRAAALVVLLVTTLAAVLPVVMHLKHAETSAKAAEKAERVTRSISDARRHEKEMQWDMVTRGYGEALTIDPTNITALAEFARAKKDQYNHLKSQNGSAPSKLLEESVELCRQALQLSPSDTDALNTMGVVLKKLKRYPEAINAYEKAIALHPKFSAPWENLGVVQALNGEFDKALESLQKATQLAGTSEEQCESPWVNLASVQLAQADPKASDSLRKSMECKRQYAWSWLLLARAELQLSSYEAARSAYTNALKADTLADNRSAWAKRILALAQLRCGNFADAAAEAQSAIDLGDLVSPNRFVLAVAAAKRGDYSGAASHIEEAQKKWPEYLRDPGDIRFDAPEGILWFDKASELKELEAEALRTLVSTPEP